MLFRSTGADYNAIEIDEIIDDGTGADEFGQPFDENEVFDCFKEK